MRRVQSFALVHGFLGNARNWGAAVSRLRAARPGVPLVTPDLLGHGEQIQFEGTLTLDRIAENLLRQLEAHGPVLALGHSFGFFPLLMIAEKNPDLVPVLICADSGPFLSLPARQEVRGIFEKIRVPFASRQAAKVEIENHFGVGSALSRFLFSHIRETAPSQHGWRFNEPELVRVLDETHHRDFVSLWQNYRGQLIHLKGAQSHYVDPDSYSRIQSLGTQQPVRYREIHNAGHWIHADNPSGFVECVSLVLDNYF